MVLAPKSSILTLGIELQAGVQVAMAGLEPLLIVRILVQLPAKTFHPLAVSQKESLLVVRILV